MIKRTLPLLTLFVFLAAPVFAQTFVFHLRGDQEVPPVASTASGGCHGDLNQVAGTFALTCVHSVVNATVMHVHQGAAGVNGPIAFGMGDPSSGFVQATWTGLTGPQITDLLAGNYYINIHTAGRPAGEIRGQILPRTVDTVPFTLDAAQAVPPSTGAATGNCTADLNAAATALDINCTHNLTAPVSAHVHEAPFGSNGPVVFTFPSAASPLSASMPLTARLVAAFAATFLYLDVHQAPGTEEDPSEEIRGQIGTPPAGAGTGTIVIEKASFPGGGTNFGFTETITPGAFTLNDGQTRTFAAVTPGTYTVTENDPSGAGYTVADVSCNDDDSSADPFTRSAAIVVDAGETVRCTFSNFETAATDQLFVFHLSGDQEVPPVATTERGGCMGRFDVGASELSLICTHNVDVPTVMHVHRGAAGANGSIAFDMGEPTSPVVATWSGMTPADVADLAAGNLYVNIHTAGRPSGVIRGQILPRTVDTVSFTLDGSQTVPPGSSPSTGNCTADLDVNATGLQVTCSHSMASPDAAHIHNAPRGENGPLVHTFLSPASPINQLVPMTPRTVADFAAELLYLDIHGAEAGESTDQIRGQIAPPLVAITTGTIRIVKSTSPAGGTGFVFTDDVPGSPGTFTLDDGEVQTFTTVPAGTYTVTENASATHSLTDVDCSDEDSTGNPFARTATVSLEAGETVTCTFRNLQSVASPTLFVFHLSGDQEAPPVASSARGGCFGQFDSVASSLALICTHNVADVSLMHIHRGAPGVNGPVAFDLGNPTSPVEATWTGMTAADVADLLAGNLYVNIHSGGRPTGELRGQILPRTIDSFPFPLSAGQEVPPTDSPAVGSCSADLADNATFVFVQCTHNVPSPTSIHLHSAPPGIDGPVLFDFTAASSFAQNAPLTPRAVADFAAGFLYVNVHSSDFPQGAIRGALIEGAAPAVALDVPALGEWAMLLMLLSLLVVAYRRL